MSFFCQGTKHHNLSGIAVPKKSSKGSSVGESTVSTVPWLKLSRQHSEELKREHFLQTSRQMPVGSNLTSWNNLCLIGGTTPVVPTILCGNATFKHHCGSLLIRKKNLSIQQPSLSRLQHMLNQSWIGSSTQKKLLMETRFTPDSSSELYLH